MNGNFSNLQDDFAVIFGWDADQQKSMSAIITAICQLGAAFGAMGMGSFIKYGKWNLLLATNLFVISGSGIALIAHPAAIIVGRFLYGFASGSFSCIVPAYITELTPKELKGPYGTLH